ncbi:MAG: glycosyltransferase [Bacteroidia bacterium]
MNYWLLTTEYPPFYGGGISTYCYHTACMLSEKGHTITVFINDTTVKDTKIEILKEARVIRFNPSKTNSDSFLGNTTNISYEFAHIIKIFIDKEGKPDIIESQEYNGIAYFLLQFKYCLFNWCSNIPIIITMHAPAFLYMEYNQVPIFKKPNYWIGEMERFCIQAADLLISPSQYLINELKQRFTINNVNLKVIPNPYRFHLLGKSHPLSSPTILNNNLTFYGKLSPQKGTFKILEEFRQLWNKGFDKTFTLIGGQNIVFYPMAKTMGKIIKWQYKEYIQKGLLKLKDQIAPSEQITFLSECIIFIIPSIVDNLPYAVLELMGQGKILIVSKQGGQSEIISDGDDGFIFDYNEPTSFERTMRKVFDLTADERFKISKNAIKKIANNYSFENIYPLKIKLVEKLNEKYKIPQQFPFIRTLPLKYTEKIGMGLSDVLLSVVIPYYNLGKYIDETVQSVLNSTYKNLEIIIVNDGSTESLSIKKLNQYRANEKITIIDKKNTGLADTRNFGSEIAKGSMLAFLDADDVIDPSYYEKAIRILNHYENVHFVGAWAQYFGNSKQVWPTFNPEPPLLLTHNLINSSALVYKREAFLLAGKNDENFKIGLEDYESVINIKSNGLNGVAIPETLFNYRVRKNSMIKNVNQTVRAEYYNKINLKHNCLFLDFNIELEKLNKNNGIPLSFDNSTLDDLPFQNMRFLGFIIRKAIYIVKHSPKLKNAALFIKKITSKQ